MPVESRDGNVSQECTDGTDVLTPPSVPILDPRSRPSAPCDIKAETNMVLGQINLDIPIIENPLLQESSCLNTKIIKDKDVKVSKSTAKVSDIDLNGAMKFMEARLPLGVDAAHLGPVLTVKPLGAAHQGLCRLECDEEVHTRVCVC